MSSRTFKFTKNYNNYLTEAERDFYEKNGYLIIKKNVNEEFLDQLCERFKNMCNGKISSKTVTVVKDPCLKDEKSVKGEHLVFKIQDFLNDDVFFEYARHGPILNVLEAIIGPNITAIHSMVINKPPNSLPEASLHPLHQDLHYFPFRPADGICASWTAMETVTSLNGCLYVIPGSHAWEQLFPHGYPPGGFKNRLYHGIHDHVHLPKVYLPLEKGDSVFIHSLLLHGSGPNLSKGFRKAISCHYMDSNSHVVDVKGTSQQIVEEEIKDMNTNAGRPMTFLEYWKIKSRLIKGAPGVCQRSSSHL